MNAIARLLLGTVRAGRIATIVAALLATSMPGATQSPQSAHEPPEGSSASGAEEMQIWRKGSPPVTDGPKSNFTGAVQVIAPYRGTGGSRLRGATVKFAPGARTAWHSHPMGQALIVTEGCGWTQREGGTIEKICAGDVAWIAPGVKHWHGATKMNSMTHVAVSETVEGEEVEWLEKVGDEEYARGPR